MLITELLRSCLFRQMNRMLRTIVQTGIANLAVVRKFHAIFSYLDVICRTYLSTDSAADAVVIYCIIKRHILIYDLRRMGLMVERHLLFKFRCKLDSAFLPCLYVSANRIKLSFHIFPRELPHLFVHIKKWQVIINHQDAISVF